MIDDAPPPGSEERPAAPAPGTPAASPGPRRFGGVDFTSDSPADNPDESEPEDLAATRRLAQTDLAPSGGSAPPVPPDAPGDALPLAVAMEEPPLLQGVEGGTGDDIAIPDIPEAARRSAPASAPRTGEDIAIPDIPEGAIPRRQSHSHRPPAGWLLGGEAFHPFAASPPPASTVMPPPPRLGPGGAAPAPTWPGYAPLAAPLAASTGGTLSSLLAGAGGLLSGLVGGLAGGFVQGLRQGREAAPPGGKLGGAGGRWFADSLSTHAWGAPHEAQGADGGSATDPDALAARLFEAERSLREAAGSEAIASLLGRAREHARRLGIPEGSALWDHLHDAALGRNLDPEARTLAASLADAIERSGAGETLREMAETRAVLEAVCLERMRTLAGRGREAQPELDRLQAVLGRLEKLEPPFEKPGEETGATRIAETARRLAQMVRRLIDGLFGRKPAASDFPGPDEEAHPPPAP